MKQNQFSNDTEPVEKSPAHFKFSLFSSAFDAWILAIALLILLFLSFINERKAIRTLLKPGQSENNILIKNLSPGVYSMMANEKMGIIRNKNADHEINKNFFGLG